MTDARDFLQNAMTAMGDRAKERDTEQERSMAKTVALFNLLHGTELTEAQGWSFMVFLKMVRGVQGNFRPDDFVDAAAYIALWAECLANMVGDSRLINNPMPEQKFEDMLRAMEFQSYQQRLSIFDNWTTGHTLSLTQMTRVNPVLKA